MTQASALVRLHSSAGVGRSAPRHSYKSLASLAAKASGIHQLFLHQRRLEAEISIERIEHRAGDGVVDVVAYQVGEFERPHPETTRIA